LTKAPANYSFDYVPRMAGTYWPSGPTVGAADIWLANSSSPFSIFGAGSKVSMSSTAPVIKPGQYIRETDSKCAFLTAYLTTAGDVPLSQFISTYLSDLFTKGTTY